MADWITAILETPYLVVPIFIWLWDKAELPQIKWKKIAPGVLLAFSGEVLRVLAVSMSTYASADWMYWPITLSSLAGTLSFIIGLAMIGFYATYYAIVMWKP